MILGQGSGITAALCAAHVLNEQKGMIVGAPGGAEWVDQTWFYGRTCTRLTDLLKVRFTSQHEGWIVGERGMLYRTMDAGLTWSEGKSIAPVPYSSQFSRRNL